MAEKAIFVCSEEGFDEEFKTLIFHNGPQYGHKLVGKRQVGKTITCLLPDFFGGQ